MMNKYWEKWSAFWFQSNNDLALCIFRIIFASLLLYFYGTRHLDLEFFYSNSGLMPQEFLKTIEQFKSRPSVLFFIQDFRIIQVLHGIFLFLLLCLAAGLFTRIVSILVFILHLSFINRNPVALYGVDMISTFYLFYLMFVKSNSHLYLDSLFFKKKNEVIGTQVFVNSAFYRLMQIQLCIIYAYSGLEKLRGTRWWNGSAVWDIFSLGSLQRWDLSFIAHVPLLIAASTYIILFWEIYFPVLIWIPKLRNPLLLIGVGLHLSIGLFLNLPIFAALMLSIYVLFIDPKRLEGLLKK